MLRPGGVLGLLWNVFDDRVPWVAELVAASAAQDRLSAMDDELPYEGEPVPVRREFPHHQAMTRVLLVDNLASRSGTVLMARQPVRTCCGGCATSRRRRRSGCPGSATRGGLRCPSLSSEASRPPFGYRT